MIKKIKLFLAPDLEKESAWLTEMSKKGYQFVQYKMFTYFFEENSDVSYIYQVDFQKSTDEYFELYKEAGWEHIDSFSDSDSFHYFRAEKQVAQKNPIYTDPESIKNLYERMLTFYGLFFLTLLVSMGSTLLSWKGLLIQKLVVVLVICVFFLYMFLVLSIYKKIKKYK